MGYDERKVSNDNELGKLDPEAVEPIQGDKSLPVPENPVRLHDITSTERKVYPVQLTGANAGKIMEYDRYIRHTFIAMGATSDDDLKLAAIGAGRKLICNDGDLKLQFTDAGALTSVNVVVIDMLARSAEATSGYLIVSSDSGAPVPTDSAKLYVASNDATDLSADEIVEIVDGSYQLVKLAGDENIYGHVLDGYVGQTGHYFLDMILDEGTGLKKHSYNVDGSSVTHTVSPVAGSGQTVVAQGTFSAGRFELSISLFTDGLYFFTYGNCQAFCVINRAFLAMSASSPISTSMPVIYDDAGSSRIGQLRITQHGEYLRFSLFDNQGLPVFDGYQMTIIKTNLM